MRPSCTQSCQRAARFQKVATRSKARRRGARADDLAESILRTAAADDLYAAISIADCFRALGALLRREQGDEPSGNQDPKHQASVPETCVDHSRLPLTSSGRILRTVGQQWSRSSHDGPAPWGETSGPSNLIGEVVSRLGFWGISSFSGSQESDGAEPGLFQITGLNLFVERSANLAPSGRPGRSGGTSPRSTPSVRATPESRLRYASIGTRPTRARRPRGLPRTCRRGRRYTRPAGCPDRPP
jgi:hypothetical protein